MTLSVAIIGAGPSGCYLAQALEKAVPDSSIDLIDRLAAPYGLVRYGVAPDHQGTKAVIRQFSRLFQRGNVGFMGNVTLGKDISLDQLRDIYDVVVLATGLSRDKTLGVSGEDLSGVLRAGDLTRWWNDHPLSHEPLSLCGSDVVILGNGNVALDIVRLIAKSQAEFEGSDLSHHHHDGLVCSGIRNIHIVGRSEAGAAKFDPAMVKELGRLADVNIAMGSPLETGGDEQAQKNLDALSSLEGKDSEAAVKNITFHFGWSPTLLRGEKGKLNQATFARTSGEGELNLNCDYFITAIGFEDDESLPRSELLAAAENLEAGVLDGNLYACGWFRRGPNGTIPENRADAIAVAARIAEDLEMQRISSGKPGREAMKKLFPEAVDFAGWTKIDAAEMAAATQGRCRQKIKSHAQMVTIAKSDFAEHKATEDVS